MSAHVDQAVRIIAADPTRPDLHESVRIGLIEMRRAILRHRITQGPRVDAIDETDRLMARLYARVAASSTYATAETVPVRRDGPPHPTMPALAPRSVARPATPPPPSSGPMIEDMFRNTTESWEPTATTLDCTCFHAPEQHGPQGCMAWRGSEACDCQYDGSAPRSVDALPPGDFYMAPEERMR